MFAGITNLDFNSTFAQLTSGLSLDALQSDDGKKETTPETGAAPVETKKEDVAHHVPASVPVASSNTSTGGAVEEKFQERMQKMQRSLEDKDQEITGLRAMLATYESKLTTLHATKSVCQVCVDREQQQQQFFVEEASLQDANTVQSPVKQGEDNDDRTTNASPTTPNKKATEDLEKRLKKFQKRVKDLDAEIKKLTDNNAILANQLQENEQRSNALVEGLQQQVESLTADNATLSSSAADASSLQNKILSLQQELTTMAANQTQVEQEKLTWQQRCEEEKNSLQAMTAKLQEQEDCNRQLAAERDSLRVQASSLQDQGGAMTSVLDIQQGKVEDAENRVHFLKHQLDTLQQRIKEFEQSSKLSEERLAQKESALQLASSELHQAQEHLEKKTEHIKEVEGKVTQLTDKLKDLMQRYAELKQKYSHADAQVEHIRQEDEKLLQSKESEVVKAKLKLERVEQQYDESKTRCQELSEKYGEAQRQLTELKLAHNQLQEAHTQLQEQKNQLEHVVAEQTSATSDYEDKLIRMKNQFQGELDEKEQKLVQITADFHILQQHSKNSMETGDMLDDYKKRAQLALKKANATIAKLTEDQEALQSTLSSVRQELMEANHTVESLEAEMTRLESEAVVAKQALEESQRRITEGSSHLTKHIEGLQQTIETQSLEIERLQQVQQQQAVHTEAHQAQALENLLGDESDSTDHTAPAMSPLTIAENTANAATTSTNTTTPSAVLSPSASQSNLARDYNHNNGVSSPGKAEGASSSSEHNNNTHNNNTAVSTSAESGKGSGQYMLVNELQFQLQELKKDLAQRGMECDDLHRQLGQEREDKDKLQARCDEMIAYLARLKKSHEDPNSAVNLEYLKNCVFKYMSTKEVSERRRLFRVIGVILAFTGKEMKQIDDCLAEEESAANQLNQTITTIGSSLEGWFGSGFMK